MPLYGSVQTSVAIAENEPFNLVNNEQLGVGNKSVQVCFQRHYGLPENVAVDLSYATPPSSVQYDIQVAINDVEALYRTVYSSTKTAGELVSVNMLQGGLKYRFLRVKETISPGVNATVTVLG
jgi:hypothetical protein